MRSCPGDTPGLSLRPGCLHLAALSTLSQHVPALRAWPPLFPPHFTILRFIQCTLFLSLHSSASPSDFGLQLEHEAFPTLTTTYTKFRAAPKHARPFPITCDHPAFRLCVASPDLAAPARGLSPSTPTCPQSPQTYMQQLAPRGGLLDIL
ncbi:hypothetical protein EDB85DRAFT_2158873 [Lactarius pseudohatsudake]|nr:hypothetical protein EDB85DRAFT_2158873 [Lactarius pseudohatsudake]